MRMQGWQWTFVAVVLGVSLVVSAYVEMRRLLYASVDDRYGEWARFWWDARQPGAARPGSEKFHFALAFFLSYGLQDLWRLITLVAFDLFVVFAILAPFWRHVFFADWNPVAAAVLSVLGTVVFLYWKIQQSLPLCRLHEWSQKTGRCDRCGESYVEPEPAARFSWHGFWQGRVNRLVHPSPGG
jgi:hypothetical protein